MNKEILSLLEVILSNLGQEEGNHGTFFANEKYIYLNSRRSFSDQYGNNSKSMNEKSPYPLTLCVINYNGERYLEESLGSAWSQKEKLTEILLIDNASTDRSLEVIQNRFPTIQVLQLDQNYGPAAARNIGFQAASAEYILFMDNDIILTDDCLDRLFQALQDHPEAVAAMPCVLYAHNKQTIQYDGAGCHFLGLMTLDHANCPLAGAENSIRKINSLVSACFLVDKTKWQGIPFFDEAFFIYFEDNDFGFRIRCAGKEILAVPSAQVYHREGTSGLSLRIEKSHSRKRVFYLIRNRWQFMLKNYALKTLLLLAPFCLLYEASQLIGVIKKGWFREWWKAWKEIIDHFPEILQKRSLIQRTRKTPDRKILQGGPIPFTKELTVSSGEQKVKHSLDLLATLYWKHIERFI